MKKIINILKKKSIPLNEFMDIALYDKKFGYYMKKNPFGKKGDYITSPLVSVLFSEMIAVWCVAFWESLGKPKKIFIVELGPGDASLSKDLLNAFKNFKNFYNCLEIRLLEKSEKLKIIQKANIKNKKVKWIKKMNELRFGPIIFLGNEFFDALPIKQFYINKKIALERHVSLSKKNQKLQFSYKKVKKKIIQNMRKLDLISQDNIVEYPLDSIKYLELISKNINNHGGGLLCFDYGYIAKKNKDTLQSIKKHKYQNILLNPGNADITSHINYNLFTKILKKNNLKVEKITNQSKFFYKLGIVERANMVSKKMNFKTKADLFYRLKKLLHHNEMGGLFKVLFAHKNDTKFSLGF